MARKGTWIHGVDDAELAKRLAERKENSDSPPDRTGGFIFMRPPCHQREDCPDEPPEEGEPPDPCRGQTWVWQPDIAVRLINPMLDNQCPAASDLTRIRSALEKNLSQFRFAQPDVRVSCANGTIDILIWGNRVQADSCSEQARRRAEIPADIATGGNFGVYVNAALIRRLAEDAFNGSPKRLSATGYPSASGPIHLTGLSVVFKSPNVVQTVIAGYDDRPWPDVSFTTTITDHLLDLRQCQTSSETDASTFDEVLAVLFAAVAVAVTVYVPVLFPLPAFVLFTDLNAVINQPDNPGEGGAGCRLMQGLPDEIALPQTGGVLPPIVMHAMAAARLDLDDIAIRPKRKKIVIPYNQPRVDARGILVAALVTLEDRMPAVAVTGPTSLLMGAPPAATFGVYAALPNDFYGTLTFQWSGGQNAEIANPNAARTRITFRRGNEAPGTTFDRTVTVRVTDAEGSTATASLTVSIYASDSDEGLPAVCQVKPWLPVCQPKV
jgi:hypothetical protein